MELRKSFTCNTCEPRASGAGFAGALGGNGTYAGNCPAEYQGCLTNGTGGYIGITGTSLSNCSTSNSCTQLAGSSGVVYQYTPGGYICITIGTGDPTCGDPIPPKLTISNDSGGPQIGMNIFQFGAFTQAYRVVKAGTAYTAVGVGTVVAAPVVPYAVQGYESTNLFLAEWAAGDFEGYTATMEMLRGFINADIVPEVPTAAAAFGSWVGCVLWGDDPCPGILKP